MEHSQGFLRVVDEARASIRECTCEDVRRRRDAGERFVLLDVREDHEWARGHLPGAVHLSRGILERDVERLYPDPDTELVLYCGGGFRSALAAESLQRMGYRRPISMDGGWRRWNELGYETEVGDPPANA